MRTANEMIAAGATNRAVAEALGGVSHTGVYRHRVNHLIRPLAAIVAAADKGRSVREERTDLVTRAEAGDPMAQFLGLEAIRADLKVVHDRLDRVANKSEEAGQHAAVATVAGQQLRSFELRGKIGGLPGLSPPASGAADRQPAFVLNIHFRGSDRAERLEFSAADGGEVINGTPSAPPDSPIGGLLALGDAADAAAGAPADEDEIEDV